MLDCTITPITHPIADVELLVARVRPAPGAGLAGGAEPASVLHRRVDGGAALAAGVLAAARVVQQHLQLGDEWTAALATPGPVLVAGQHHQPVCRRSGGMSRVSVCGGRDGGQYLLQVMALTAETAGCDRESLV